MSEIREIFACPSCGVTFRTDWDNAYLAGASSYAPDTLACPACGAAPMVHVALEIEEGALGMNPRLSVTGQQVLDQMREATT